MCQIIIPFSVAALKVYDEGQQAMYATSKAAVHHYTKHLAAQLQRYNVNVNCICPGGVLTGRALSYSGSSAQQAAELAEQARRQEQGLLARTATIDEVARVACFSLERWAI